MEQKRGTKFIIRAAPWRREAATQTKTEILHFIRGFRTRMQSYLIIAAICSVWRITEVCQHRITIDEYRGGAECENLIVLRQIRSQDGWRIEVIKSQLLITTDVNVTMQQPARYVTTINENANLPQLQHCYTLGNTNI
jgi:hypothetical protein